MGDGKGSGWGGRSEVRNREDGGLEAERDTLQEVKTACSPLLNKVVSSIPARDYTQDLGDLKSCAKNTTGDLDGQYHAGLRSDNG